MNGRRTNWIVRLVGVFVMAIAMSRAPVGAVEPKEWARDNLPSLVELYRHFHTHPELSLHEAKTAERVAEELKAAGCETTKGVGGHGVVGMLASETGADDGPLLLLRCDLDALPVAEKTDLPYASKVTAEGVDGPTGVMHACGHDLHMTNLIGVARYLGSHRGAFKGRVMFVCQPAEEKVAGAAAMLADGLFDRFGRPDFGVALHVDAQSPAGTVAVAGGPSLANVDSVDITILGKGGHGAYPHTTVDPIVTAAHLVVSLQSIVAREIKPTDPAVVTVGSIHGGKKHNIIDDRCHLQLTVRSYDEAVQKKLLAAIERRAKAAAMAAGAPEPIVKFSESCPALVNDQDLADRLRSVFVKSLGKENVLPAEPSMGAEDFSRFGQAGIPVTMYRLGSVDSKRLAKFKEAGGTPPSLHSPFYYPDAEQTLTTGVQTMASVALELLKP